MLASATVMRLTATTLALALCLLGCGSAALPPDRVQLMVDQQRRSGCYLTYSRVNLVADPTFGTAVGSVNGSRAPVFWPPDYTGHRVGSEVEVRDPTGKVVATTGRAYNYWPAELDSAGEEPYIGFCLTSTDASALEGSTT